MDGLQCQRSVCSRQLHRLDHLAPSSTTGRLFQIGYSPSRVSPELCARVMQVQNGKRAVNRKGFGYGGEDAYFYTMGPRCVSTRGP